jgi:hypothetical protein
MKSLFNDKINETSATIGRGSDNSLVIKVADRFNHFIDFELDLQEAIIFQQEVNRYVMEMKEVHRSKLPWWRIGTL